MENLDEALAGEGGGIGAGGVGGAEEGVGGLFVEAVEGFGFEGVELGVEAEGGAEGGVPMESSALRKSGPASWFQWPGWWSWMGWLSAVRRFLGRWRWSAQRHWMWRSV